VRQDKKAQIREQIRSNAVNKDVNITHQNRHFRESDDYIDGRSYFYDNIDPEFLIQQYHGTGEIRFSESGDWINKEFVTLENDIGIHIE